MVQSCKASIQLLVANQQFTEAVEPTVANLHDPAASRVLRIAALGRRLLLATHHMRDVAMALHRLCVLCACVCGIGAQMLAATPRRVGPLDHDGIENQLETFAVMHVGSGHDERQRDATPVHQQVALASFFSPDPLGWDRYLLVPSAP